MDATGIGIDGLKFGIGAGGSVRREPFKISELSSFGEDAAGELYATSLDGTVYKLSP